MDYTRGTYRRISCEKFAEINCWGLSRSDLLNMVNDYEQNESSRRWIESLLTDCNFHHECGKLCRGEFESLRRELQED